MSDTTDDLDWFDGEPSIPYIDFIDGEWTDANGDTRQIKDMELRHIKNCIGVLKNTLNKWDYPNGDKAEIKNKIREFQEEISRRHRFERTF